MTTATRVHGGLAAPLLHWLVVVSGLALLATADIIDPDAIVGTWIGAIAGTIVGQGFAWLRLRAWAAVVITMFLVIVGAMSMLSHSSRPGDLLAAFVPAAACGYLSLTSRGTLAYTSPLSRVVHLCPHFLDNELERPAFAQAVVIHEMLHTLGLGEDPPSSREITDRVRRACAPR